jgi:hypothetical protein
MELRFQVRSSWLSLAIPIVVYVNGCGASQIERYFFSELRRTENELLVPHRTKRTREIEAYRQTVALGERVFGRTHPALVPPFLKLGEYDRVLIIHAAYPTLTGSTWRQYAKAANLFGRPLSRREATHLYLISEPVALNGLAGVADRTGQYELASRLYREALKQLLRHESSRLLLDSQFRTLRWDCLRRGDRQCVERVNRRLESGRSISAGG